MENMDKKNGDMYGHCCAGGSSNCNQMHGWHGGGRFYLVGMLLKLIIVALIFCFGFNLGQTVGFIKAGYGRGMMGGVNTGGLMRPYIYGATPTTPAQ